MTDTDISFRIDGTLLAESDTSLPDWPADVYELDGLVRGEGEQLVRQLNPDTVLELQLADGTRLLVAAEDAGRYLGPTLSRGDAAAADLAVGQRLHFSGVRPPPAELRAGIGTWALRALRIFRRGPAAEAAQVLAASYQSAQLAGQPGLYQISGDDFELVEVEALPAASDPTLVFIHGTASSTRGSFQDLWTNAGLRQQLQSTYGTRLFGFEHHTLTESPVANALDLVRTLPTGARLHLVSHSRGGMIGELLARAGRIDLEPFTEAEIERFLAHAGERGLDGHALDATRLTELNRELINRAIRVERFVRVACPARGTTLVSGRLDRWASVMLNLLGKGFDTAGHALPGAQPVIFAYQLFKRFLLAVVQQRTDARILPGLEAMMPDSPLVDLLNAPDVRVEQPLHVLAGDFAGDSLLSWLGDCLSEVFYGGETDLVVNTPSMSGGAIRLQGLRQQSLIGREVTHFSYFERAESARALVAALRGDDSDFDLLQGPSRVEISRGGKKPKHRAGAPVVYLLPGIMGSHLQRGRNRIWFDPFSMWTGKMMQLRVQTQGGSVDPRISPDGWMDRNYEKFARYLADTHEVRPFAYDWRLSITNTAERFGEELDRAFDDVKARGQPLHIVGHSMGGLVARLALKGRWERFREMPGSRLLQLGTPNRGSHSMATVLLARDDFVQTLERWFDFRHDMRAFLELVRDFPGVLELLPWPGEGGVADDGVDYFDPDLWDDWHRTDGDPDRDRSWAPPQKGPLQRARAAVAALQSAAVDPSCSIYVAGRAPTPAAVRIVDGAVEIGWIEDGDGRVPWRTGIPAAVPVWYTDAAHGDLASHSRAFGAYLQLLVSGHSNDPALTQVPPRLRGDSVPLFVPRSLTGNGLYPSPEEVVAAATGGTRPGRRSRTPPLPLAAIELVHGSLASADSPVLIGAYANDSLRGSGAFLDGHLGGQLLRTHELGRYPAQPDEAMVFFNTVAGAKPAGAIVVGLGPLGDLLPGVLTEALVNGLLEYVRCHEQGACPLPGHAAMAARATASLEVSTLLVGTGFTGLTVEVGVRCLVDALRCANEALARTGSHARIARMVIHEETEDRAVTAAQALRELLQDAPFAASASFDGRLRTGAGGYRGRCLASGGEPGTFRMHIVAGTDGGLCFTVITNRARNEVSGEANQRQAVDGLMASITSATRDQPGLSRALFELLLPNSMKQAITDVRTLMMSVDTVAGAYPWELMRDSEKAEEDPLATRVEMIRQLASSHGRGRVPTVTDARVFVVGDTESGHTELPGAQAEARAVAEAFAGRGYEINALYVASAQQVFEALFYGRYRFMHLAGHGVVEDPGTGLTGMVLGPKTFLTTAQIQKLRHVPEFVFLNCCHLGNLTGDGQPRWGELAANLATQFIEMGCKAVIAAGWAVEDGAANTFARSFYQAMLAGTRFGRAVLQARATTYRQHPQSNSWGAFQAYGDERYRFPHADATEDAEARESEQYMHSSHLIADLDMFCARLQTASNSEKHNYYRPRIMAIEEAARRPDLQQGCVREKLACAWAELGDMERAIGHYRAVLSLEDAGASLRSFEQLANLESRYGARLLVSGDQGEARRGEQHMKSGLARLKLLLRAGPTAERLSLLGSHWKRRAQVSHHRGHRQAVEQALDNMQKAYWQAAEHARQRQGEWDYYPLFNALDSSALLVAAGDRELLKQHAEQLPGLLQLGLGNARRRYSDSRDFFHALADIEAQRIDALWACYDGRSDAALTASAVSASLNSRYREILLRLGSSREQDSLLNHLQFLMDMLPSGGKSAKVAEALQILRSDLEQLRND